jgi:hypothetical protein
MLVAMLSAAAAGSRGAGSSRSPLLPVSSNGTAARSTGLWRAGVPPGSGSSSGVRLNRAHALRQRSVAEKFAPLWQQHAQGQRGAVAQGGAGARHAKENDARPPREGGQAAAAAAAAAPGHVTGAGRPHRFGGPAAQRPSISSAGKLAAPGCPSGPDDGPGAAALGLPAAGAQERSSTLARSSWLEELQPHGSGAVASWTDDVDACAARLRVELGLEHSDFATDEWRAEFAAFMEQQQAAEAVPAGAAGLQAPLQQGGDARPSGSRPVCASAASAAPAALAAEAPAAAQQPGPLLPLPGAPCSTHAVRLLASHPLDGDLSSSTSSGGGSSGAA